MAEQTVDTLPAIAPPLEGMPIGEARRMARKRAGATVEIKLVESEEKQLHVVRQFPVAGDELSERRVIKVEIATRPWIQFLPGVYQDADEENADFLQRFLLISAHLTSGIEERLEYRREIIQRVPELYRLRGTARGLELALRLFADVKAEIHEGEWPYPGMVIGRSSTIGKDTVLSPPVFISQCFTVELPDKKAEISRERLRTVQALVETEKPAHAHYALVFQETEPTYEEVPFLHVGKTGRIGVDARIGGQADVPEAQDEELQKLGLSRRN